MVCMVTLNCTLHLQLSWLFFSSSFLTGCRSSATMYAWTSENQPMKALTDLSKSKHFTFIINVYRVGEKEAICHFHELSSFVVIWPQTFPRGENHHECVNAGGLNSRWLTTKENLECVTGTPSRWTKGCRSVKDTGRRILTQTHHDIGSTSGRNSAKEEKRRHHVSVLPRACCPMSRLPRALCLVSVLPRLNGLRYFLPDRVDPALSSKGTRFRSHQILALDAWNTFHRAA